MNSDETEQLAAPYLTTNWVIILPISSLLVLFTLYGIYIVIFALSIRILTRHQYASKLYLWCTVALFLLDTTFVVSYTIGNLHQQLLEYETAKTRNWNLLLDHSLDKSIVVWGVVELITTVCLKYVLQFLFLTTVITAAWADSFLSAVADCTLIHRCYVVLANRKWVLYPLAAISVIINGVLLGSLIPVLDQYITQGKIGGEANKINDGAFVAAAVFNFTLSLMTAGRIWWVSRNPRKDMGKQIRSRYTTIVAIILESGSLYSMSLLACYMVVLIKGKIPAPFDPTVITTQFAGLAPTLLIVRVAYNKSMDSAQENQRVSTLAFADRSGMQESRTDRRDVQQHGPPGLAEKSVC